MTKSTTLKSFLVFLSLFHFSRNSVFAISCDGLPKLISRQEEAQANCNKFTRRADDMATTYAEDLAAFNALVATATTKEAKRSLKQTEDYKLKKERLRNSKRYSKLYASQKKRNCNNAAKLSSRIEATKSVCAKIETPAPKPTPQPTATAEPVPYPEPTISIPSEPESPPATE